MSNGTQEQNRNNGNRNRNRNRNRNNNGGGNNRNRPHNPNQPGSGPRPQSQHQKFVSKGPVKLTLWQKILKMVGLYKEPVKPSRNDNNRPGNQQKPKFENAPATKASAPQGKPARTNTRDARNGGEARPPREPRERREPSTTDVESTRLYIGNLSFDATESDIEELFKGIGPVRSVEIVYNRHTHKSKGYGFVEMLRIDEAKRSVEVLHDQHFMGRQLVVSGAKAKNVEDGEARLAARESKDQAAAAAPVAAAAVAPAIEAPAAIEIPAAVEETVAAVEETVEETTHAIVEEVHSLESDTQKETFA